MMNPTRHLVQRQSAIVIASICMRGCGTTASSTAANAANSSSSSSSSSRVFPSAASSTRLLSSSSGNGGGPDHDDSFFSFASATAERQSSSSSSSRSSFHTSTMTTLPTTMTPPTEEPPPAEFCRLYDTEALSDLFFQYADPATNALDFTAIRTLMGGIGETPCDARIQRLFDVADLNGDGVICLQEFLEHAASFLGNNPARIILVVGGPGSGKGVLSQRLEQECNAVHLSSGDLLRREVAQGTALGRQVQEIMARGELVSSAVMVALMKKRMQDHPGKRVLLDGFPRSLENAHDLMALCGRPEMALHLVCDDTILMERIMARGMKNSVNEKDPDDPEGLKQKNASRDDDNFHTALKRLRSYHAYHHKTIDWLRDQHVPIVNLDCSGSAESVWQQLVAIGRLMRPAVKKANKRRNAALMEDLGSSADTNNNNEQQRTA